MNTPLKSNPKIPCFSILNLTFSSFHTFYPLLHKFPSITNPFFLPFLFSFSLFGRLCQLPLYIIQISIFTPILLPLIINFLLSFSPPINSPSIYLWRPYTTTFTIYIKLVTSNKKLKPTSGIDNILLSSYFRLCYKFCMSVSINGDLHLQHTPKLIITERISHGVSLS